MAKRIQKAEIGRVALPLFGRLREAFAEYGLPVRQLTRLGGSPIIGTASQLMEGCQPNSRAGDLPCLRPGVPAGDISTVAHNDFSHLVRSFKHRMNRTLVFATVLASGLATTSLFAQAAPAVAAPTTPAAAPAPVAIPAKIAVIAFEQVAGGTNEGQKLVADLRKKYEPKNTDLQTRAAEVESLKKQLQALPASAPDEDRAKRIKDIDIKDKRLQQDAQDLQQEEQGDFQDGFGKLMQKVGPVAVTYAKDHGFTVLLNTSDSQQGLPTVLWWDASTDISQAVVNAYNVTSGVAAPPPSAPTPTVHHTAPSATTPKKQ